MRLYMLIAGLLLAFYSHGQATRPATLKAPRKTKYDPQVYEVTNNGIDMSVSYLDSVECAAKFEKDAQLNRWSEVQRSAERAKLPRGGYLKGTWSRSTLSLASADNFVFLVEDPKGKELTRVQPSLSIARPFSLLGATVYTDLTLVPMPAPLPDGARVFVIEASSQRRFEYVIHPGSTR